MFSITFVQFYRYKCKYVCVCLGAWVCVFACKYAFVCVFCVFACVCSYASLFVWLFILQVCACVRKREIEKREKEPGVWHHCTALSSSSLALQPRVKWWPPAAGGNSHEHSGSMRGPHESHTLTKHTYMHSYHTHAHAHTHKLASDITQHAA